HVRRELSSHRPRHPAVCGPDELCTRSLLRLRNPDAEARVADGCVPGAATRGAGEAVQVSIDPGRRDDRLAKPLANERAIAIDVGAVRIPAAVALVATDRVVEHQAIRQRAGGAERQL